MLALSVMVEILNMKMRKRYRKPVHLHNAPPRE